MLTETVLRAVCLKLLVRVATKCKNKIRISKQYYFVEWFKQQAKFTGQAN